jgi:hypothetical protein
VQGKLTVEWSALHDCTERDWEEEEKGEKDGTKQLEGTNEKVNLRLVA